MNNVLSGGTVHTLPEDWRKSLLQHPGLATMWETLTPLARNEWICWIETGVKPETRERHLRVAVSKMSSGIRRPCCWAGCKHREKVIARKQ